MSDLFEVYILSANFRTCFFYFNSLSHCKNYKNAIKIQFGPNRQKTSYGSISLTPVSEVPSKFIGIASSYANKLGLKENDVVLVSYCDADSISKLEISPTKEEDYVILLCCKTILETYLLNQVSVVAEGQILPLYVFSNISIDVEIGKLDLQLKYGQLQKFTEITVLHPSKRSKDSKMSENQINSEEKFTGRKKSFSEHMYNELCKLLENNIMNQTEEQKRSEIFLKHLVEDHAHKSPEYKIQPFFLFSYNLPKNIQNKFIILSYYKNVGNTFGPYCVKILAKVQKASNSIREKEDSEVENNNETPFLYCYVISLNVSDEKSTVICPQYVMKKLKLFVGSKIKFEQVKPNSQIQLPKWSEEINFNGSTCESYWKSIKTVKESLKQTVINNFKYNDKINSLILGGPGCGKTFLLTNILDEFTNDFIFCKILNCKALRGKKIDTLTILFMDALRMCSTQEPSLLLLDDLHAITYVDEEEGQFNKLYSERVVDSISKALTDFQEKYNISVIASAVNLSQLSSLISQHGPRLFPNVLIIPEMNFNERSFAVESIINSKIGDYDSSLIDLNKISMCTNGYTIQDLNDLIQKAIFNCHLRNENEECLSSVCQRDFDFALSELTPLNLKNVKLKQTIDIKWENVGGMLEAKKILLEIFSWPVKYPKLLESCPLRLQRGVLLYGAPGTGKTLLAGASANQCGLNFISVKGPEVLSKYVGASEEGVRNLFHQAQKTQPCLLFFDEFDSLAPKRGHDNTGVTDRVVNQLLTQLDGVESLSGVWVLAATSRPDLLDPALLRPGRLDKMVFCDVPDQADRLSILEVLSANLSMADDVDLLEVAENSKGYTGADLQAILYSAQMSAIKHGKSSVKDIKIKQTHLRNAFQEVKPSLSGAERQKYKKIYEKFVNSRKKNFVDSYDGVQRVTLA